MAKTWIAVIWMIGLMSGVVSAGVLVEWDIENAGRTAAVLSNAEGLDASEISTSGGITPLQDADYPGSFAASGWQYGSFNLNQYYTFTVTAQSETAISIGGISLSLCRGNYNGNRSPAIGAESWMLRSSADNFDSDLATYSLAGSEIDEQVAFAGSFDETLALANGDSLEFRLYGYCLEDSQDFSGLVNMSNDIHGGYEISGTGSNVVLYGNSLETIPEPATFSLIGVFLLIALFVRRTFSN